MLATMLKASLSARPLPTFVSSSSTESVGSTTNIVTAPSGIQNGDLLVAVIYGNNGSLTLTLPSGFTNIPVRFTSGLGSNFYIATKIASSESGNYTFTWSSSATSAAGIMVYRNATTINCIGAVNAQESTIYGTGSITPTFSGTFIAAFAANTAFGVVAEPSGMTLRENIGGTLRFRLYDLANQSGNVEITTKTFEQNSSTQGLGFGFQITNEVNVAPEFVAAASTQNASSSTSLVINKPTGTASGDLMIAVMSIPANSTWTGGTDWTEVADQGSNPSLRVAYKVAGGSEPASYTFTSSANNTGSGTILTYRYAAYDTIAGAFTTGANPLLISSITSTQGQSVLIAAGARSATSVTLGTPVGMTARATDNDATSPSRIVCDQIIPKGPTGVRSMSTGNTSGVSGIMLSVKPTRSL